MLGQVFSCVSARADPAQSPKPRIPKSPFESPNISVLALPDNGPLRKQDAPRGHLRGIYTGFCVLLGDLNLDANYLLTNGSLLTIEFLCLGWCLGAFFADSWSFFSSQLELLYLQLKSFLTVGNCFLRNFWMDCQQRSSTVSKNVQQQQNFSPFEFYSGRFSCWSEMALFRLSHVVWLWRFPDFWVLKGVGLIATACTNPFPNFDWGGILINLCCGVP